MQVPVETKQVERLWRQAGAESDDVLAVRSRVLAARNLAQHLGREPRTARLAPDSLRGSVRMTAGAERLLLQATSKWSLSPRAVHRTLRVARTIADLAGREATETESVAEALTFRHETADS